MQCILRFRVGVMFGFLGMIFAPVDGVEVVIRAVQINDTPIAPSDHVTIDPDDSVVLEFFISGWGEDLPDGMLRTYQVTIDGVNSFWSGTSGSVMPGGIDIPGGVVFCHSDADCPSEASSCRLGDMPTEGLGICVRPCFMDVHCLVDYPECPEFGYCVGEEFDPETYAFIDAERPDFALYGFAPLYALRLVTVDYVWGSASLIGEGPLDTGTALYVGTLIVMASNDACGSFTLRTVEHPEWSFVELALSSGHFPDHIPIARTSMVIDVTCPEVAACCRYREPCIDVTKDECMALGGVFYSGARCDQDGQKCPSIPGSSIRPRRAK